MKKLFLIFLLVFSGIWGVGILASLLVSKSKPALPPPIRIKSPNIQMQKTQRELTEKVEQENDKLIEDQEFQMQQQRRMMGIPPSSDGRYF